MTVRGFDLDIRGEGGFSLAVAWVDGPNNCLGPQVARFRNLFTVTGPGRPSVLCTMISSCEQRVDRITACLGWLDAKGVDAIAGDRRPRRTGAEGPRSRRPDPLSEDHRPVHRGEHPRRARVFMPYVGGPHRQICNTVAADGYYGFRLSGSADRASRRLVRTDPFGSANVEFVDDPSQTGTSNAPS